ncbi:MAG: hypothetical protein ACRDCW_03860 [Sarcina sp.]
MKEFDLNPEFSNEGKDVNERTIFTTWDCISVSITTLTGTGSGTCDFTENTDCQSMSNCC